mmetsp:Transcript_21605/g.74176  ORF Transcript_21605/g.74176 Transcript_21605/m.74176 type:complete len:221 (-) Transcript_21605:7-669(-)
MTSKLDRMTSCKACSKLPRRAGAETPSPEWPKTRSLAGSNADFLCGPSASRMAGPTAARASPRRSDNEAEARMSVSALPSLTFCSFSPLSSASEVAPRARRCRRAGVPSEASRADLTSEGVAASGKRSRATTSPEISLTVKAMPSGARASSADGSAPTGPPCNRDSSVVAGVGGSANAPRTCCATTAMALVEVACARMAGIRLLSWPGSPPSTTQDASVH